MREITLSCRDERDRSRAGLIAVRRILLTGMSGIEAQLQQVAGALVRMSLNNTKIAHSNRRQRQNAETLAAGNVGEASMATI